MTTAEAASARPKRRDWVDAVADHFLSPAIRNGDPRVLRRARLIMFNSALVAPLLVAYTLREFLFYPVETAVRRALFNIVVGGLHLAMIASLRIQSNVRCIGNLAVGMTCAAVPITYVRQGTMAGEPALWAVAVPVMGIAFLGRWPGLPWVLATVGLVFGLEMFPAGTAPPAAQGLTATTASMVICFLAMIAFLYDWQSDRTLAEAENYRRQAEDSGRRAEDSADAQRRFLANMSHEIRTPLTAILGFADEVLHCGDLARIPRERLDAIDAIRRNGQHLAAIVDDILDLSKIQAGALSLERVSFSPLAIAEEVASTLGPRAKTKGLELTIRRGADIPGAVVGDPTRIRQVLFNLVGNALKFTQQGRIEVAVDWIPSPSEIEFSVSDSGIGMSEAQIARIFEPFVQADASTTRKYGGTGLGLTICKRMVELMGGRIEVKSESGHGSTFSFGLPTVLAAPVDLASPVESEAEVRVEPLCARILVVEDSIDNQRLLRLILERAGAEVEVVGDGHQALVRALDEHHAGGAFDLILMDLQMPVLDGYDATRALREAGYAGRIIALTAHALAQDREEALRVGCDGYLTKPIRRRELVSRVALLLSEPKHGEPGGG